MGRVPPRKLRRASRRVAHAATRAAARGRSVRDLPSPRYHQVYVALRTWVRDGTYKPGDQLPTEPALCTLFGVSRITVRKAIEDLAREGWLVRRQGRGTFVQLGSGRTAARLDLDEARGQVADLADATEVRDLKVAEVAPDEETRAALDLPSGALVQRATHVRLLAGVPLGLITTYLPLDVAHRVNATDMAQRPLFELLGKAGIEVGEADQLIGATLAGVQAAPALQVDVGAPLLRVTRVVYDRAGKPVERVVALYRADAYQYRMQLRARPGAAS